MSKKGHLPDAFIEDVAQRADILEVVSASVNLKKSGANYFGLCPFHNEKSPSFSVSPTKGFYHCFGCGAHGDAIKFKKETKGLNFREAVIELANDFFVPVPEFSDETSDEKIKRQAREDKYNALKAASELYASTLSISAVAADYLSQRNLTVETIKRFGIGFSPKNGVSPELVGKFSIPSLLAVGVLNTSNDDGEIYDTFQRRVVFPIRDERGRVIGFSGRKIDDQSKAAKYINTKDTELFSKSQVLFGLYEALESIRSSRRVLAVEGNIDVAMYHQYGLTNTVAPMGTALTTQHARKLTRIADVIDFAFDGDNAGRKARNRTLETILPLIADGSGKQYGFIDYPAGEDPDSFMQKYGLEGWAALEKQAKSISTVLLEYASEKNDNSTPEGLANTASEATRLISLIDSQSAPLYRQAVQNFVEAKLNCRLNPALTDFPIHNEQLLSVQPILKDTPKTVQPLPEIKEVTPLAIVVEHVRALHQVLNTYEWKNPDSTGAIYRIPIPSQPNTPVPAHIKTLALTIIDGNLFAATSDDPQFNFSTVRGWDNISPKNGKFDRSPLLDELIAVPNAINAVRIATVYTSMHMDKLKAANAVHVPLIKRELRNAAKGKSPIFRTFVMSEIDLVHPVIFTGHHDQTYNVTRFTTQASTMSHIPPSQQTLLREGGIMLADDSGKPREFTHRLADEHSNMHILIGEHEASLLTQRLMLAPSFRRNIASNLGYAV